MQADHGQPLTYGVNISSDLVDNSDSYSQISAIEHDIDLLNKKVDLIEEDKEYNLKTIFDDDNSSTSGVTNKNSDKNSNGNNNNIFLNKKRNPEDSLDSLIKTSKNSSPYATPIKEFKADNEIKELKPIKLNETSASLSSLSNNLKLKENNSNFIIKLKEDYIGNKKDEELIKEYKSIYNNSNSKSGFKVFISSNINLRELYDWKVFEKLKKCKYSH